MSTGLVGPRIGFAFAGRLGNNRRVAPRPLITLLTDFGTKDGYVGAMKGVLLSLLPEAVLLDLTHDVPPGDVLAGALALMQAVPFFPHHTVHLAVVDPGVGTDRRPLIRERGGQFLVGPDNGLLARVGDGRSWTFAPLPDDPPLQPTFHGRDLFARAAARLAGGRTPEELGAVPVVPLQLAWPEPMVEGADFLGEVVSIDRFGNLLTNLDGPSPDRPLPSSVIELGRARAPIGRTFGDVVPGELVAYRGSLGLLEIALRDGNAAERLGARRGTPLRWRAG